MGLEGILMTGDGSFVEKVTADSNAGGGMSVAGSVIESVATQNGGFFGIIAITVRDCTAVQNFGDGILLNEGGVATGNILFLNKAFGISAFCPSSIIGNTIVSNVDGSITISGTGCTLANNATRP